MNTEEQDTLSDEENLETSEMVENTHEGELDDDIDFDDIPELEEVDTRKLIGVHTISKNNYLIVPQDIREQMGWGVGDHIKYVRNGNSIELTKVTI